jgi:DNA polymerase III delta prime subunit
MLWANKYRPGTFEECIGGIKHLSHLAESMQHLLLHSRGAGTGKTTLAYVLANQLGYQLHIFNASSKKTRGIGFVEEELIPLTRSGNYKQIILRDEADQLTAEAQGALKGVIENSQGFFILTCNDESKVTQWIKSRCLNIEIMPPEIDSMMGRLEYICGAEGVVITDTQLRQICIANLGDMRNAINALQAYASFDDPIKASQFVRMLGDQEFDVLSFLKLSFQDRDMESSLSMLKDEDARSTIRNIFNVAIDGKASVQNKLLVVDAAITAERDIISGVDEYIVKANFVRMLVRD